MRHIKFFFVVIGLLVAPGQPGLQAQVGTDFWDRLALADEGPLDHMFA
jgi:hypothetical protein